jgi:hypothetical protein
MTIDLKNYKKRFKTNKQVKEHHYLTIQQSLSGIRAGTLSDLMNSKQSWWRYFLLSFTNSRFALE